MRYQSMPCIAWNTLIRGIRGDELPMTVAPREGTRYIGSEAFRNVHQNAGNASVRGFLGEARRGRAFPCALSSFSRLICDDARLCQLLTRAK